MGTRDTVRVVMVLLLAGACIAAPGLAADEAGDATGQKSGGVVQGTKALFGAIGSGLMRGFRKSAEAPEAVDTAPAAKPAEALPDGGGSPAPVTPSGSGNDWADLAAAIAATQVEDVHAYEGALAPEDLLCGRVVEPFAMTGNLSEVVSGVAANRFAKLLGVGADPSSEDPEKAMKVARESAKKLNWLPMPLEIKYGKALHDKRRKTDPDIIERTSRGPVQHRYEAADAVLARVLDGVGEEHPYEFKLFLVNRTAINAAALPGGYLYLTTGALDSPYADLVLAHELAHVLKRHQTRELQARLIDSVHTEQELKKLLKEAHPPRAKMAKRIAALAGAFVHYSRQQELQADACAVRIVDEGAPDNLDEMVDGFVATLEADETGAPRAFRISTHPGYPERAERMKRVARELDAGA